MQTANCVNFIIIFFIFKSNVVFLQYFHIVIFFIMEYCGEDNRCYFKLINCNEVIEKSQNYIKYTLESCHNINKKEINS